VILLGAEILLRSASVIARMLGVSPLVIGLTVVSVGTSTPELAVGITAATEGRGALAVGNIAGTNIFNILFILGLSAALRPLPIGLASLRLDVPAMIASAVVLILMALDGRLTSAEGALLLCGAVIYTALLVRSSRQESAGIRAEFDAEFRADFGTLPPRGASRARVFAWQGLLLLTGIALAVLGADLMVNGATNIAYAYGVSDAIVGLTIVAIGTSAPELATTILATLRNDRDVAIGNLIGSSIFNITVILGLTLVAIPGSVDVGRDILWIDLPLAALVALVCLPVFRSEHKVTRQEGTAFVLTYVAYMALLVAFRT
jgi:cation:H+ antiporter